MVQEFDSNQTGPSPSQPQYLGTTVSHLCSLYPRRYIITGMFREQLVRHFSSENTIEIPELKHLVWKKGQETDILIEVWTRWVPEMTEFRPGIVIRPNAYTNDRKGIGERLQGPPTDRLGRDHFSTFWGGSHTLFCIGGSGMQADLLAEEVKREIQFFAPKLQRNARLKRLRIIEVGGIGELEEAQENFVVPVTVGYYWEDSWVLRQESPILRSISLKMIVADC